MNPTRVNASREIFLRGLWINSAEVASHRDHQRCLPLISQDCDDSDDESRPRSWRIGNAASMKPYVVGFKRRGIDAVAVDLPRGGAEKAVPVFIKTSGRGHEVAGGGQSFGGRVASMAAVEADFGGLILFSYPLHRPGFPDQ